MKYIAKDGLIFIILSLILSFAFLFLYYFSSGREMKPGPAAAAYRGVPWFLALFILFFILFVFNVFFFRDPERRVFPKEEEIISPADGRVIFLGEVFDGRFLKANVIKISIFMSLFNVHVNRTPLSGRVEKIIYNKGKFFSANLDKASMENEYNGIILAHKEKKIAFVQIAGLVARRIVCRIKEGDIVKAGERFGLIKYGSRLDVYLPQGFENYVKVGDKVFSGKTILGRL